MALAALLVIVALFFLKNVVETLLVIFAGVLFGVLLNAFSQRLASRLHISHGIGLAIIVPIVLGLLVGLGWLLGPGIADQVDQMNQRIPEAVEQLKLTLKKHEFGRVLVENMPGTKDILPFGEKQLFSAPEAFSSFVGAILNLLIILFIGFYLAASPRHYFENSLKLIPKKHRDRVGEVLHTINEVLQRWLIGRVASMIVVGILTSIGLWLAGVPLAITLGLIAAVLSFVPFIGPMVSTIPAILVALGEDPILILYVLIIFAIVQTVESYIVTPLIQKRAVSIPPALLISFQILMGAVFGALGVFLATPTAVIVILAVQMFYIEDVLGDKISVLGHH